MHENIRVLGTGSCMRYTSAGPAAGCIRQRLQRLYHCFTTLSSPLDRRVAGPRGGACGLPSSSCPCPSLRAYLRAFLGAREGHEEGVLLLALSALSVARRWPRAGTMLQSCGGSQTQSCQPQFRSGVSSSLATSLSAEQTPAHGIDEGPPPSASHAGNWKRRAS